jgi:hypothetical protein
MVELNLYQKAERGRRAREVLGVKNIPDRLYYPGDLTHEQFARLKAERLIQGLCPETSPHGMYFQRAKMVRELEREFHAAAEAAKAKAEIKFEGRLPRPWNLDVRLLTFTPEETKRLEALLGEHSQHLHAFNLFLHSGELEAHLIAKRRMNRPEFEGWLLRMHRLGKRLAPIRQAAEDAAVKAGALRDYQRSYYLRFFRTHDYERSDPERLTHLRWLLKRKA